MSINSKTNYAVEVDGLTKVYQSNHMSVTALREVNLFVNNGEIVTLTGPSGSGKSTLLHIIGSLDTLTTGAVQVGGQQITRAHEKNLSSFRLRTVGIVFQNFYLEPYLTVRQNIEVPSIFAGLATVDVKQRIERLASIVGLTDRLDHMPHQLSGGEAQRVAIARSLINSPAVLLADEPTGNLDGRNRDIILNLFQDIRHELGTTVVIATHDPVIVAWADRSIKLIDGEVV